LNNIYERLSFVMLTRILMKTVLNKIFLLCLFLESLSGYTQNLAIGEWRIEVPYSSAKNVVEDSDYVYCSMNTFIAVYDKNGKYIFKYDKLNGLSDLNVTALRYHKELDILFLGYQNSNIDLISKNEIFNIEDLKRSTVATNKIINSVDFHNNIAYLSCGFGITVLDLERKEFKETYYIGQNGNPSQVFQTCVLGNNIYAATEEGIKAAALNKNLINYQSWNLINTPDLPVNKCTKITIAHDRIYAIIQDSLFSSPDGENWQYVLSDTTYTIANISVSGDSLLVCERNENEFASRIKFIHNGSIGFVSNENFNSPYISDALITKDKNLFVADFFIGFCSYEKGTREIINPNSLSSASINQISIYKDAAWLASGNRRELFNDNGVSRYKDNWWSTYSRYNFPIMEDYPNIYSIAIEPSTGNVFWGSYHKGIFVTDESGNLIDTFSFSNSSLQPTVGDEAFIKTSGLAFDSNNNLWAVCFGAANYLSVKTKDGVWKSFRPTFNLESSYIGGILIDKNDNKWLINPVSAQEGIVVFNENVLENTADDKSVSLKKGVGLGNLASNEVLSIAEDLDGEIWVGTAEGLSIFYCASSILSESGCDAQEILVTAPDGFVGTLLGTERIQAIAIDGANRKWIGTTNGLWLFSPDGTKQIEYFNSENSPLISNIITALAVNPITGIVYIGTDKGLALYRSDATDGNEKIECENLVFPNPVRENYYGTIAISCLPQNSDIKITDVAGNLVFKTTAYGGQAVWDGRHPMGDYVKAGVYLVFASNEDGSSKQVSKILVMR
jgi:hypothetical protein